MLIMHVEWKPFVVFILRVVFFILLLFFVITGASIVVIVVADNFIVVRPLIVVDHGVLIVMNEGVMVDGGQVLDGMSHGVVVKG